jgi:hypothetical protein
MRKLTPSALLVIGLVALGTSSCSRQAKPAQNPWAQVAPGSWVTMRTAVTFTGKGEDRSHERHVKLTLLEVTEDKVVLERATIPASPDVQSAPPRRIYLDRILAPPTDGKQLQAQPFATHPAVVKAMAAAADLNTVAAEGEETLQIGDRSIQTKWTQYGKGAMTKKEWTSPEVPGTYCKRLMRTEMGDMKEERLEEVTAFEKR